MIQSVDKRLDKVACSPRSSLQLRGTVQEFPRRANLETASHRGTPRLYEMTVVRIMGFYIQLISSPSLRLPKRLEMHFRGYILATNLDRLIQTLVEVESNIIYII